jgi:hypothetical protein
VSPSLNSYQNHSSFTPPRPLGGFNRWWKGNSWLFHVESAGLTYGKYVFTPELHVPAQTIVQNFAEGITNCLLTPIMNWAVTVMDEAVSKSAKGRYIKIISDLNAYMDQFSKGIPETAIPEICNKLQIDITIESPFNSNPLFEYQSTKKRLRKFKFVYTRIDHVELNQITICEKPINISTDDLKELKKKLDDSNTYYTCKMNLRNISSIST